MAQGSLSGSLPSVDDFVRLEVIVSSAFTGSSRLPCPILGGIEGNCRGTNGLSIMTIATVLPSSRIFPRKGPAGCCLCLSISGAHRPGNIHGSTTVGVSGHFTRGYSPQKERNNEH